MVCPGLLLFGNDVAGSPAARRIFTLTKSNYRSTEMKETYEPTADNRIFAHAIHDLYVALRAEGFTQAETLMMLATIIGASMREQAGGSK